MKKKQQQRQHTNQQRPALPGWNKNMYPIHKRRQQAYQAFIKHGREEDQITYKELQRKLKKMVKKAKAQIMRKHVENIMEASKQKDPAKEWEHIYKAMGLNSRKNRRGNTSAPITLKTKQGTQTTTPELQIGV